MHGRSSADVATILCDRVQVLDGNRCRLVIAAEPRADARSSRSCIDHQPRRIHV
jgi:hypothetical protein